MFDRIILRIKRQENPMFAFIYRCAKKLQEGNLPTRLLLLYRFLFWERKLRLCVWKWVTTVLYYSPMFRSRCAHIGPRFRYVRLQQPFPFIDGNLKISFGEQVIFHSRSSISGGKVFDEPDFSVGSFTYLGPGLSVGVGKKISIGSHCHLSSDVRIADNDGHPIDPIARSRHETVTAETIKPVCIKDYAWIGDGACILKGVTIGRGAVVAARSVVTCDVDELHVVAGNPARVVRVIDAPVTDWHAHLKLQNEKR